MVALTTGGDALWVTPATQVLVRWRPRHPRAVCDWGGSPLASLTRRQELRRDANRAERTLWGRLRGTQMGTKFRRQHPIGPFIADFYSRAAHLVVELDGDTHSTTEAQAHDAARTLYMESQGLLVLRFANHQVLTDLDAVSAGIFDACRDRIAGQESVEWVAARDLAAGDTVLAGWPLGAAELRAVAVERADGLVCRSAASGISLATQHGCLRAPQSEAR
ncbi:MAG: DUF559 domain-containing protein [Armatimonadetes bacterium]|nr:DUF559 domain-containing protein [Armatimonadota bacterium]